MSEPTLQPIDADDPGLTAYALGELEGPEAARYRAAVAASAELQAVVAEIQAAGCLLTNELAQEPQIPITAERRSEIAAQANQSQPVVATQKRTFRFSRRVVAVAASVALIPGAWYAFQAAFPRLQRSTELAKYEASASQTKGSDDDVFHAVGPTIWRDTRGRPRQSDELGDLSSASLSEIFEQEAETGSAAPSDSNGGLRGVRSQQENSSGAPAGMPGGKAKLEGLGYAGGARLSARPGPMVDGPGVLPPIIGLERQTQSQQQLLPGYRESVASARVPILNKIPHVSRSGGKPAGGPQSKSSESEPHAQLAESQSGPDHASAGGAGAMPGGAPGESKASGSGYYRSKPLPPSDQPELRKPISAMVNRLTATLPSLRAGKESAAAKDPRGTVALKGPSAGAEKPFEDAEAVTRIAVELDSEPGDKQKGDGKQLSLARAPEKGKPDTFDFTDESLDGVRNTELEREFDIRTRSDPTTGEAYKPIYENAFITPQEQQLSTFSIDVDTASYANLRRFVQGGQLPPPDAVRIEELVNYFSYQYPQPQDGRPFSVQTDIAACPWQPGHQLVRIGLKGKEIPKEQRSPTNLVFLVDVSGSMQAQNKLPLVRESLKTLVKQLDERDKVAIVTYAGEAGVRLPSTSAAQREVIVSAIDGLGAGGSTNGAAGINTAYDIAAQEFLEKGTNRVILCTDGDFNVGVTSDDALVKMIQTRAKGGVFLSVFGFGMGNLKDAKLEQLADKGNGQYGYIDDQQEANKVFVQELMGTLVTIAKDVKIQIDFNKDTVASYRLVGYENRVMAAEDFHDDKKDAGEIGAGHTVTALYQIVPIKDLKANEETRWLTVKLRYKQPDAATSVLMENPLVGQPGQLKLASSDFQFAASVAACGMLLRHSQHAGHANWGLVKELAQSGLSYDPHGHRRAFIGLAAQAESLMGQFYPQPMPATDSTVGGKYKSLLRRLHAPTDAEKYGQFNEFGHSDRKAYAGAENLPEGYWVYAAPYWYIWAETTAK